VRSAHHSRFSYFISTALTRFINTNIRNVEATVDDQMGRIDMTVEINDVKHLQKVIKSLRGIDGVIGVERASR